MRSTGRKEGRKKERIARRYSCWITEPALFVLTRVKRVPPSPMEFLVTIVALIADRPAAEADHRAWFFFASVFKSRELDGLR